MKVHEIMTSGPRTISPNQSLVEAAGLMRELDIGALPVCEGEILTGMLTDRDMVVRGIADGQDPVTVRVAEVMSRATESIFADQDVEEAAHLMERRQIRRLPVLDREKRLVGMVSLGDIATSSNPAFSGLAIREISTPNRTSARHRHLTERSETSRVADQSASPPRRGTVGQAESSSETAGHARGASGLAGAGRAAGHRGSKSRRARSAAQTDTSSRTRKPRTPRRKQ